MSLNLEVPSVVKKSVGFVDEFKAFISRGNVVDLAVGVIIGGAFGQITTSLVNDIVMPPIGWLASGHDFASQAFVIQDKTSDKAQVVIAYGHFLNTVINFLIISFVIFLMIKLINKLKRKEEAKPVPPTTQEKLLIEIRDLLAKGKAS